MTMERASLIFAAALADMRVRMGVEIADMTPDEIRELVHACDREANPFRGIDVDLAGIPVRLCDGVWLWKLTIGASIWLDEHAEPILGRGEKYKLAMVYAMINSRDPSAFDGLDDESSILAAVKRELKGVAATAEEINAALDVALGVRPAPPRDVTSDGAAADWASICARLETQTGIPARTWIWEHSSAYALKCYHDLHDFAAAYSSNRRIGRRVQDDLDLAVQARQALKVEISRRVKARKGEN